MVYKGRQKYFETVLEEDAIIFYDHEAVGFITKGKRKDDDKDCSYEEICGIYLSPEHRNKGMGTKLINRGLNELKEKNYRIVTLWVLEDNFNARRFYEKIVLRHDGSVKKIIIEKN